MTRTTKDTANPLLGVLGGMGPLATVDFLHKLIEQTPAACDADHVPVVVYSVPQIPDRPAAITGNGESPLPHMLKARAAGEPARRALELLRAELGTIAGFPDLDATFDRPVLWLAGERSPYVKPEHAEPMKRLFPRTTSVTIKGAGHWLHSEKPEAFASALRTFLLAGA